MTSRDKRPGNFAPSPVAAVSGGTKAAQALRLQAEETLRQTVVKEPKHQVPMSAEEIQSALHELRVHQIELEMQNDELRRTQVKLDAARAEYFNLYDLAPVGYFTISMEGLLLKANLTAAKLLSVGRGTLAGKRLSSFILKEDQDGLGAGSGHLSRRHCRKTPGAVDLFFKGWRRLDLCRQITVAAEP